jgi:hypothetical protein
VSVLVEERLGPSWKKGGKATEETAETMVTNGKPWVASFMGTVFPERVLISNSKWRNIMR